MTDSMTWWEATFEFAEDTSDEMGAILIEAGALGVQTISDEIRCPVSLIFTATLQKLSNCKSKKAITS